jgi:Major capsid protein Gp23
MRLPRVRRVVPSIIAHSIVRVSPMVGPVFSISTLREKYMTEMFYKTKYSFHPESRWKPHWLELWYDYNGNSEVTNPSLTFEITKSYSVWRYCIRHELVDFFGSDGPGHSCKWSRRPRDHIVLTFKELKDVTFFDLWLKGQSSETLFPLYRDYPH